MMSQQNRDLLIRKKKAEKMKRENDDEGVDVGLPAMPANREASSIRTLLMLKLLANQYKNNAM